MASRSSSVSSGAASRVHGDFSDGPKWSSMCAMPPSPPARWKVRHGPSSGQRRPGPSVIDASICAGVASPLATMCRASRQIASCSRLAMKPGTSRCMVITDLPATSKNSEAHATAHCSVRSPPTTSTKGMRYGGLNGCPTTSRCGVGQSTCISVMPYPEVEDEITTPTGVAASMRASRSRLSARSSGALSCTNSASATASSSVAAMTRFWPEAPAASPSSARAGHAASTSRRSFASKSGAGSQAVTR